MPPPLAFITDPFFLTPLVTGLALVVMCAAVSVLVVLKRLSFVGQGVSHSAFGGIGVAALCSSLLATAGGAAGAGAVGLEQGGLAEFAIVLMFCVLAALAMAAVADRRTLHVDTGIGLMLVASMALGGLLVEVSRTIAERRGVPPMSRSWESVLFGSISTCTWTDAAVAWVVAGVVVIAMIALRRPMLFWALDEQSAPAFGVPARAVRAALMVVLAVVVVTAMKLAGVVPATALLVLPGAIALQCSTRLGGVVAWSLAAGAAGLVAGLMLSVWLDLQPGPCIVLLLTIVLGAVMLVRQVGGARPSRAAVR